MKLSLLTFFFLSLSFVANAQLLKGKIIDAETKRPISGAVISARYSMKASGNHGEFSLILSRPDTLLFSSMGYVSQVLILNTGIPTEIVIELKSGSVDLLEVTISAARSHKADSLKLRKDYAKDFNYTGVRLKDIFLNAPANRGRFEYVSINLLQLVSLIGQKNNRQNKMKRTLYADEKAAYINSRFKNETVARITTLKGDSLLLFMEKYRPSKELLLRLSDYELVMRIKTDLIQFKSAK